MNAVDEAHLHVKSIQHQKPERTQKMNVKQWKLWNVVAYYRFDTITFFTCIRFYSSLEYIGGAVTEE